MNTNHHRTSTIYTSATCGNLALSTEPEYRFTVIEGGRRSGAQPQPTTRRAARTESRDSEQRMSVRVLAVITTLFVMLAFASVVSDELVARASIQAFSGVGVTQVCVATGDSLWAIAEDHPVEGCSTSQVVTWIRERNGLTSATIMSGQELIVPQSQH